MESQDNYNTGKMLPHALDVEEVTLGACLIEKNAFPDAKRIINADHFYKLENQVVFAAMEYLYEKGEDIDLITVFTRLKQENKSDEFGGRAYLSGLSSRVGTGEHVETHAKIIRDKYLKRELIKVCAEYQEKGFQDSEKAEDLISEMESALSGSLETITKEQIKTVETEFPEIEEKHYQLIELEEGEVTGVSSGFDDLDKITNGFQPGDLVIVGARPSMGKTALMLCMALNFTKKSNEKVLIFSLEMSARQLVIRLLGIHAEEPTSILTKRKYDESKFIGLKQKSEEIINDKILIDDRPGLQIRELFRTARRQAEKQNIKAIYIDYITLINTNRDGNREQEVSYISRELKSLAKELNVPVIVLSQLNRGVEGRGGEKKPMLSDLRESGSLEQDADIVIFPYRPLYYTRDEDEYQGNEDGVSELLVKKNRNGAVDDVPVRWISEYSKFTGINEPHYSELDEALDAPRAITPNAKFNTNDEPAF